MAMGCKGICRDQPKRGVYFDGYKRCGQCRIFWKTDDIRCKCCGLLLKSKPRGIIRRTIHNNKLGITRL